MFLCTTRSFIKFQIKFLYLWRTQIVIVNVIYLWIASFKKKKRKDLLSIIIIDKLSLIIIRFSCHLWKTFCPKFQIWQISLLSIRKYRSGSLKTSFDSIFKKKKLFLNGIAFTIALYTLRCEFSYAKRKKTKKKKERKSKEIVSHRHRHVPMIVDNRRWRKLILRILKSILLLLHVSQKFRGYRAL